MNTEWDEELAGEGSGEGCLPLVPAFQQIKDLCQEGPLLAQVLLATGLRLEELPQLSFGAQGLQTGRPLACDAETLERLRGWQYSPPALTELTSWLQNCPLAEPFRWSNRPLTARIFRHSYAVQRLEAGVDLIALNQLMGHRDLRTTQAYIAIAMADCRAVYERTHPFCARLRTPQADLTTKDVLALIDAASHPLIVRLLYASGLRVSELNHFTRGDINEHDRKIFVRTGKGEQDRYVLLDRESLRQLLQQAASRPPAKPVFPISRDGIWDIVKEAARDSGLQEKYSGSDVTISPHGLRHACASHCYQAGMPPEVVSKLLGHTLLRNTLKYVDVPWSQVESQVRACHPWIK